MKTVKQHQDELNAKQNVLHQFFEVHKTAEGFEMTPAEVEQIQQMNAELNDLGQQLEGAKMVDLAYLKNAKAIHDANQAANQLPLGGGSKAAGARGENGRKEARSLGELFTGSEAYTQRKNNKHIETSFDDFDFLQAKTLMETTTGWAPQTARIGRVAEFAHRRPVVADLIPQTPTEAAAISFMEETTFTNAADTVLEGGEKPESALAFAERTETIREIATWLPVTEVQVEDVPVLRSLIENRLITMLELTEEVQILTGSGVAPDLTGFLVKAGVQSQAKGADPVPDAIYKAMTLVRYTGFAEPSGLVIHPNDWQDIRLLRTTDGIYIWGSPAEAGPERVWGLPAVITTAETENTALLGDFMLYSEIFRRRGATVKVSDSHSDFFVKNKLAIRVDERMLLAIYRAAAFCKVTGI